MSTRESLELECDTPECTYTLGYFSNHSSLLHKSTKDGWYRDAWTDRCPECVAKMSEPERPEDRLNRINAALREAFFRESGTQRAATTENDTEEVDADPPEGRIPALSTATGGVADE